MSLLQNARSYLRARRIHRQGKKQTGFLKERVNMATAQTVGILFDASELGHRQAAMAYARQLQQQHKKVSLLGYFNVKQDKEASHNFPFFDISQINWLEMPKGTEVDFFLQQKFDIFAFLNPISTPYAEYIAALSIASLKVGPVSKQIDCFDLMLDVKNKATLKDFITQLQATLQKTHSRA